MADTKFFDELSEEQKSLSLRIFDLVLGRVLKKAYLDFDGKTKKDMDKVFSSNDDEAKEKFIKKYIPNIKKLLGEEAKNIEEEIKKEIEKEMGV